LRRSVPHGLRRWYNLSFLGNPVEEKLMAQITGHTHGKQLALFSKQLNLPRWEDLTEPIRAEVLDLLAQLMARVLADERPRKSRRVEGGGHE
jgi:hypothetical protein